MTIFRVLQGTRATGRILSSFLSTRVDNPGLTMIGQSKISSFFSSSQQKRKAESDQVTPEKKIKSRDENVPENIPSTPPSSSPVEAGGLTPEQKKMIYEKKLVAKAKLLQKSSLGLVTNMGHTWLKALEQEFSKPYFQQLCKFVSGEREKYTIFPPADEVFSWTQLCEIKQVKVVILGQDPYHGPGQAHGLCFSVKQGIQPPPSLENMYKELGNDIEGFSHPGHGTLTGWATQGVLLLNACLTVRARNANSHAGKGWEKFTDAVISWLNKNQTGVIFILWGAYAQKKGACIDKKKHHILKGVHPSPLSAHRGFFGSKHFSTCNKLLKEQGKKPIDWCHLPRTK